MILNIKKNVKGVTLVALVVTIVVLIILAMITLRIVFNDNGIMKRAQDTDSMWANAEKAEEEKIANILGQINQIIENKTSNEESIANLIGKTVKDTNKKAVDEYGNKITIPKGFAIVPDGETNVEYNYTGNKVPAVQDGIVIQDEEGNQFVWIPVGVINNKNGNENATTTITLGRYYFDSENIQLKQEAYTEEKPENYKNQVDITEWLNIIEFGNGEEVVEEVKCAKNLAGFVESAKKNGGYYFARYEASYHSGTSIADYLPQFKVSTNAIYMNDNTVLTKGMLWNVITQQDASAICRNFYKDNTSIGVESDLINSYAWDTALVFIEKMGHVNYYKKIDGNGTIQNTGTTGDKVCNIYDMGGNLIELTTEVNHNHCVTRGGTYFHWAIDTGYRYGVLYPSVKYTRNWISICVND